MTSPQPFHSAVFAHVAHKPSMTIEARMAEFLDEVRLADELGIDYFFTTEHHFSGDFSLSPSQPVTLAAIAAITKNIRFGPMTTIMPLSEPLRVVEEFLILDHLSGGRLDIGVGRGSRVHEPFTYGIQESQGRARLAEAVDFMIKAFTTEGRFSWMSEHYTYLDIELPWRPQQAPHPPIWIPTTTPELAKRYAQRGFGMGGFGLLPMHLHGSAFEAYQEGWEESGRPIEDQRLSYMAATIIADTDAEAEALMIENLPLQMEKFQYEAARSYEISGPQKDSFADFAADPMGAAAKLNVLCGSAESVTQQIQKLRDDLGINVYMGEFAFGDLAFEDVSRSIQLFNDKVIPTLRMS